MDKLSKELKTRSLQFESVTEILTYALNWGTNLQEMFAQLKEVCMIPVFEGSGNREGHHSSRDEARGGSDTSDA
jgi:hypothetical protein